MKTKSRPPGKKWAVAYAMREIKRHLQADDSEASRKMFFLAHQAILALEDQTFGRYFAKKMRKLSHQKADQEIAHGKAFQEQNKA